MIFETRKTIRFSHCDAAGIVFYPRYAEFCNEVVEDWFARALGVDFAMLHGELQLGIPAVRLEIEYLKPSRLAEELAFMLQVTEIGNCSLTVSVIAVAGGEMRVRMRLKVVMVSLAAMTPIVIDEVWRNRFGAYLEDSGE